MRSFAAMLIACLLLSFTTTAQKGKIEGKVIDSKGQPIPGISVILNGTKTGVSTSNDGYFVINADAGKQSITLTSTNYQEKKIDEIEVIAGQLTHLDIIMEIKVKSNEAVVVKSTSAKKETVAALITYQKNTSVVAQVISAEAIRRSPDKNTGEVLKRVPGTSVQDGKYLVVRGLADRYNQAMLNGILLSSTEPDRKTFSFDLFPSAVIDNIIVNKTFIPELPGEWAGGLIQVNTKDIPSKGFLSVQLGTGFNSQTIGQDFYTYKGGKYDWLGLDDKTRRLPTENFPVKTKFEALTQAQKNEFGRQFTNTWNNTIISAPLNASLQLNGGFSTKLFNKKIGGSLSLTYSKSNRRLQFENKFFSINNGTADVNFDYYNNKYSQDVLVGALGNLTIQLNSNNKITVRNLFNINASDYTILRTGLDFESDPVLGENVRAKELAFKSSIYNNTQINGDHNISKLNVKLKWYGGFGILDQYIPDQRRIQYNQDRNVANAPYLVLISNTLSQKSGSRFYSNLNDYIYTAGGDVAKTFDWLNQKQTVKAGYLFQVKDRLFDARPFSVYLPTDNPALKSLDESNIFNAANIGGASNFAFDEISGNRFRYMANSILNAGFLQFDNLFTDKLRLVWGLRVEHFDQVVGSVKRSDPRHVYSKVIDYLPGFNLTYKLNNQTNLRLAASQTVIRPEFREISSFAFFDFELGATILGNPALQRTKITNFDLRYEIYPKAGELVTLGVFYKHFSNPIELFFNQSGVGTSSTFNYLNAEKAIGYGVELELRKKLDFINPAFKNFTLYSNLSYIANKVEDSKSKINRPMQGQSPYVINVGLQYDHDKAGLNTTLLFNQIGRRILYVGNEQVPAIWENPRPLLDFQIAKKVVKNKGEIRLNIADILNRNAYFYHDLDDNSKFKVQRDAVAINRRYGTTFSLTFGYNIK
jgi:TonB-dependent receptor